MSAAGSRGRRKPASGVSSRSDWRAVVGEVRACVQDALSDDTPNGADVRAMTLGRKVRQASFATLEREAGRTTADTARALVHLAGAFTGSATQSDTRREMAGALASVATLLEDQLHALATREFQRAHAGRPEVWG